MDKIKLKGGIRMKSKIAIAALLMVLATSMVLAAPTLTKTTKQSIKAFAQPREIQKAVKESVCKGDMNGDGKVNFGDINPFVNYLKNITQDKFETADMNSDGVVNQADINIFVEVLTGKIKSTC